MPVEFQWSVGHFVTLIFALYQNGQWSSILTTVSDLRLYVSGRRRQPSVGVWTLVSQDDHLLMTLLLCYGHGHMMTSGHYTCRTGVKVIFWRSEVQRPKEMFLSKVDDAANNL